MSKARRKSARRNTRADAIAANVAPGRVTAHFDDARAAADAAAHASSAVTAQMQATGQGPAAASDAVARGQDQAGRSRAARRGHAADKEAARGMAAEKGLLRLEPAADAPTDATATVEDGDPVSWAMRNFNLRS